MDLQLHWIAVTGSWFTLSCSDGEVMDVNKIIEQWCVCHVSLIWSCCLCLSSIVQFAGTWHQMQNGCDLLGWLVRPESKLFFLGFFSQCRIFSSSWIGFQAKFFHAIFWRLLTSSRKKSDRTMLGKVTFWPSKSQKSKKKIGESSPLFFVFFVGK